MGSLARIPMTEALLLEVYYTDLAVKLPLAKLNKSFGKPKLETKTHA